MVVVVVSCLLETTTAQNKCSTDATCSVDTSNDQLFAPSDADWCDSDGKPLINNFDQNVDYQGPCKSCTTCAKKIDGFDYMGQGHCNAITYKEEGSTKLISIGTIEPTHLRLTSAATLDEVATMCKSANWCGAFAYKQGQIFLYIKQGTAHDNNAYTTEIEDFMSATGSKFLNRNQGNTYTSTYEPDGKTYRVDFETVTANNQLNYPATWSNPYDFCYKKRIDPCGGIECSGTGDWFGQTGECKSTNGENVCASDYTGSETPTTANTCETGICDEPPATDCVGEWSKWSRSYEVTTQKQNGGTCTLEGAIESMDECPTDYDLNDDDVENVLDVILLVEHVLQI